MTQMVFRSFHRFHVGIFFGVPQWYNIRWCVAHKKMIFPGQPINPALPARKGETISAVISPRSMKPAAAYRGLYRKGFAFALLFASLPHAQEGLVNLSVLPIGPPIISEKKAVYTVDFLLKPCPRDYWWYYDASTSRMVIEFYDVFIKVIDTLTIHGKLPIREVEVKNLSSPLVNSRRKAQIQVGLKEEMLCDISNRGDTLSVILSKALLPGAKPERKKGSMVVPVLVILASAFLTVAFFERGL